MQAHKHGANAWACHSSRGNVVLVNSWYDADFAMVQIVTRALRDKVF